MELPTPNVWYLAHIDLRDADESRYRNAFEKPATIAVVLGPDTPPRQNEDDDEEEDGDGGS